MMIQLFSDRRFLFLDQLFEGAFMAQFLHPGDAIPLDYLYAWEDKPVLRFLIGQALRKWNVGLRFARIVKHSI